MSWTHLKLSAKCRTGEEFSALCPFGEMSFRRSGFRQSVVHRIIIFLVHGIIYSSVIFKLATQAMTQLRDNLQEVIKSLPPHFQLRIQTGVEKIEESKTVWPKGFSSIFNKFLPL